MSSSPQIPTPVPTCIQDTVVLNPGSELTPIELLPCELLVHLTSTLLETLDIKEIPRALFSMTWVCRGLRLALIDAAELWAHISFFWPKSVREVFLVRAGPHPLTFRLDLQLMAEDDYETAVDLICSDKIRHLSVQLTGELALSFLETLQEAELPSLRTINLGAYEFDAILVDDTFLRPATCASLSALRLHQIEVESMPRLPNLRRLELISTNCPVRDICDFLLHTPDLSHVLLDMAVVFPDATLPDTIPALPPQTESQQSSQLQYLNIRDTFAHVVQLVTALPIPKALFNVEVTDEISGPEIWSSSNGSSGVIISRLITFWANLAGGAAGFAIGHLTWRKVGDAFLQKLSYTHPASWTSHDSEGTPPLYYYSPCRIAASDPLLDHVTHLCVESRYAMPFGAQLVQNFNLTVDELDFNYLPGLKDLTISDIGMEMNMPLGQRRMQRLEEWIMARQQEGRPLQTIKFQRCSKALSPLFERLSTAQVAESISWVKGDTYPDVLMYDSDDDSNGLWDDVDQVSEDSEGYSSGLQSVASYELANGVIDESNDPEEDMWQSGAEDSDEQSRNASDHASFEGRVDGSTVDEQEYGDDGDAISETRDASDGASVHRPDDETNIGSDCVSEPEVGHPDYDEGVDMADTKSEDAGAGSDTNNSVSETDHNLDEAVGAYDAMYDHGPYDEVDENYGEADETCWETEDAADEDQYGF